MIEDEDRRPSKEVTVPRPLAGLSVGELEAYKRLLEQEIGRVEEELRQRRDVRGAAEAIFKRPPSAG